MPIRDFQNIHEMLKETVDRYPDKPAYKWFLEAGRLDSVTWKEFYEQVQNVSKSLIALGVKKNDKVNILSYTSYRWILADFGITSIGACTVGIYQSNLPKDCEYIINHSDAVVIFAQDDIQLNKLLGIRKNIPNIRKVVLLKGNSGTEDKWVISFEEFLKLGKDISGNELKKRVDEVTPLNPAGIVYTSGTTGVPKGAVLTHDNITFTSQSVHLSTQILDGDEVFLFLPLAHVFARTCVYATLLAGCPTTITRSMDTIIEDIKIARPHWFASVPRIYEKVYSKVLSGAEAKGGLVLKIFRWACDVGYKISDLKQGKKPIPVATAFKYKIATKLVFSKIQEALGGRVRWCISGAAPLNPAIGKFFNAAGILVLEGIGMTENTSFTNLNRYDNFRFGWVGQPGPGIEQKLSEEGEVMYRGRNVMKEYYKMPEDTAKTITEDGWQYTGDLGEIDSENFLRITGRKKDLIITSGGKNIAPSAIEGVLATSKYINQICVIGDRKNFLSALVTIDPDNVKDYAGANGIPFKDVNDLIKNEKIKKLIEDEIAEKNKEFASFESIKKITIVPEFTIDNGLLTPTMKLKKNVALDIYKNEIEAMYK
ncbi:MAG: long-chain fatty acid--CoA ligase [Desulfobacterales bacterium]